jgi:hypothetical protein
MSRDNITPHATFSIQYSLHFCSMIKDGVSIRDKFEGFMMKPTSKSILTLLKLDLTKMNHTSVKTQEKENKKKKYLIVFTQSFVTPRVTTQHANTPFCKPFTP